MKFFTIMIFSLTCLNAHADCQDEWLRYESPKQWLSVAYSEGCYQGDLILSAEKKVPGWPDKIGPSITTNFDKECPLTKQDKKGEMIEFSCRKDGISPLAGATYVSALESASFFPKISSSHLKSITSSLDFHYDHSRTC